MLKKHLECLQAAETYILLMSRRDSPTVGNSAQVAAMIWKALSPTMYDHIFEKNGKIPFHAWVFAPSSDPIVPALDVINALLYLSMSGIIPQNMYNIWTQPS